MYKYSKSSNQEPRERRPIAFFIPSLTVGGAQRVVVNLANALVDITDSPIHVVLINSNGPFVKLLRNEVKIINLNCSRTLYSILPLRAYLLENKPSVIMSSMNYVNIVTAIVLLSICQKPRLVLREATIFRPVSNGLLDRIKFFAFKLVARICYRQADLVVANSEATKASLTNFNIRCKTRCIVLPNPVYLPVIDDEPVPESLLANQPYICAIGRLVPEKGFSDLIISFSLLKNEKVKLYILGEGPDRARLEELILYYNLCDRVFLPGFVDSPQNYLVHSSGFVLSSKIEGFGNVIVEALSFGVPVVSTDCPGAPSEILDKGKYGILVQVGDHYQMRDAIQELLYSPPATPSQRRLRANSFSPDIVAKLYWDQALK